MDPAVAECPDDERGYEGTLPGHVGKEVRKFGRIGQALGGTGLQRRWLLENLWATDGETEGQLLLLLWELGRGGKRMEGRW